MTHHYDEVRPGDPKARGKYKPKLGELQSEHWDWDPRKGPDPRPAYERGFGYENIKDVVLGPIEPPPEGAPMESEYSRGLAWAPMRTFPTGATRSGDDAKLAYKGFISPIVLKRFAEYMRKHCTQADGTLRAPDNWKKGIPMASYKESLIRHVIDFWRMDETDECNTDAMEDLMCAIIFNAQGWLHEMNKED